MENQYDSLIEFESVCCLPRNVVSYLDVVDLQLCSQDLSQLVRNIAGLTAFLSHLKLILVKACAHLTVDGE